MSFEAFEEGTGAAASGKWPEMSAMFESWATQSLCHFDFVLGRLVLY